ncbi:MAG: NAD-dependent epimerase/dehydratase family protein [Actinobacteria bacterium]|nr:NAD-dependent epimerase/dehydratase family protein [Actinomycetota bacterium]
MPQVKTTVARPRNPYAVSKLTAESYTIACGLTFDLPTIGFRFLNVHGPFQAVGHANAAAVPSFIEAALSGLSSGLSRRPTAEPR